MTGIAFVCCWIVTGVSISNHLRHAASVVTELRRKQESQVFAGLVWCPQAGYTGEEPSWLQTNRNNQGSLQYNIGGSRFLMRARLLWAVLLAGGLLTVSAGAFDQSAPFGLSWGPVVKVPRPSLATREDNLTLLVYRGDRVPNEVPDTEEVVLGVCKNEGLQQVVWISRFFSGAELNDKLEAVLAEGTRRYGRAEISEQGIISWNAGRTFAASKSFGRGLNRLLMATAGPEFDPCSEEHKSMTGHTLNDHWTRFLPNNGAR